MTDRDALIARIDRAAEAGLIGSVDRDIRVANVKHAQSATELELIARDLDQLEGSLRPTSPSAWIGPPSTGPVPTPGAPRPAPPAAAPAVVRSGAGKAVVGIVGCVAVVVVLVTVLAIGIVAFVAIRGATSDGDAAVSGEVEAVQPGPPYGLDEQGITDFLATYRERFGTGEVVELVLYDDYAVVQVPVAGKARSAGWLYRDGKWQELGGVRASFPGAQRVDTGRLDVAALIGNVERARTTLGVDEVSTTYAIVRDYSAEERPQVDIHVANEYGESGYLATRLRGAVVRAHPHAQ